MADFLAEEGAALAEHGVDQSTVAKMAGELRQSATRRIALSS